MSSSRLVHASIAAILGAAILPAGTAWAQNAQSAAARDSELDEITVTGSRIIADNVRSPNPITAITTEEAQLTTPSDIADALNKLPEFLAGGPNGGATPRSQGNGATNNGNNVLALRAFGASRTLVMLDGHRVVPSNQNGTVNIDVLPQMLVSRVDIVTGGASAVYGSDAVAGVVNYVLDKNFTGLKLEANAGISKYGDGEAGEFGVAWGTSLLDGRDTSRLPPAIANRRGFPFPIVPTARTDRPGYSPAMARQRTRGRKRRTAAASMSRDTETSTAAAPAR